MCSLFLKFSKIRVVYAQNDSYSVLWVINVAFV